MHQDSSEMEPQGIILAIWVNIIYTEITIEVCSKGLFGAIGKVLE